MKRVFNWKHYKYVTVNWNKMTIIFNGCKIICDFNSYEFYTNFDTEDQKKLSARRRDDTLHYDFDKIKNFYDNNLSK